MAPPSSTQAGNHASSQQAARSSTTHPASDQSQPPTAGASVHANGVPYFSGHNDIDRQSRSDYKGWMATLCVEPPGDAETCCLGFFVPCVLYSKTYWRLNRIALNLDASNASWKAKDGCNTACWVWLVLPFPIPGILTAFQRSQVRGTYGVAGKVEQDCALGICCSMCTLMENDREVRAREGAIQLRASKKYKQYAAEHGDGVVTEQPNNVQHMAYLPPQQEPNRPSGPRQQELQRPPKSHVPLHASVDPNNLDGDRDIQKLKSGKRSFPKRLKKENSVVRIKAGDKKGSSLMGTYRPKALFTRHQNIPDVIVTHPSAEQPQNNSHTTEGTSPMIVGISKRPARHSIKKGKDKESGPHTHSTHDGSASDAEADRAGHDSLDVFRPSTSSSHNLTVNENLPVLPKSRTTYATSDHVGLSYVHDFTGCPIDKAVLEYYEKEEKRVIQNALALEQRLIAEKKAKQPAVANPDVTNTNCAEFCFHCKTWFYHPSTCAGCGGGGSRSNSSDAEDHSQHHLSSCGPLVNAPSEVRQHPLASCSPLVDIPTEIQGHRLASCPVLVNNPPPGTPPLEARQHRLASCPILVDAPTETRMHRLLSCPDLVDAPSELREHRLISCTSLVNVALPSAGEHREHRLASCESLVDTPTEVREHRLNSCSSIVDAPAELKEHRLDSCSTIVDIPSELQQHRLDSCNSVVDASIELREHRLDSCSTVVDIPSELQQHRLASCASVVDTHTELREHRLDSCSTVVDIPSELQQHRLASCASVVDLPTELKEHRLASCSSLVDVPSKPQGASETDGNPDAINEKANDTNEKANTPNEKASEFDEKGSKARGQHGGNSPTSHHDSVGDDAKRKGPKKGKIPMSQSPARRASGVAFKSQGTETPQRANSHGGLWNRTQEGTPAQNPDGPNRQDMWKLGIDPKYHKFKRHQKRHQKTIENLTNGSDSTVGREAGRTAQAALEKVLAQQKDLEKVLTATIEEVKQENSRASFDRLTQEAAAQPRLPRQDSSGAPAPQSAIRGRREDGRSGGSTGSARGLWAKLTNSTSRENSPR